MTIALTTIGVLWLLGVLFIGFLLATLGKTEEKRRLFNWVKIVFWPITLIWFWLFKFVKGDSYGNW